MAIDDREALPLDCAIIQEIYDNGNAQEQFEIDLDQALEAQRGIIIIEPAKLGDETSRWITIGNCLHKTAVLAGVTCLAAPVLIPTNFANFVSIPMGTLSIICASIYGVSWQFDPCCKYQVEYDYSILTKLPVQMLGTSSPVVLVRKDDKYRKALHNLIAAVTAVYMGHKFYHWMYQWNRCDVRMRKT